MSKPIRPAVMTTVDGQKADVSALFDSGSFHSLIREDKLPAGVTVERLKKPKMFGTADTAGKLVATGMVYLEIHTEGHDIDLHAFVSPTLSAELIVGAGDMQRWDITLKNDNGHTTICIGHDLNDPDIQTVL